jgi:hypothetical protein
MMVGVGLMANAALALQFSEQIEEALGVKATPEEEKQLKESMPRVSAVNKLSK